MRRVIEKKGSQYYWIILSLIMGIIIFAIFMYWIYTEFFTEEEADLQICRQSIEVRGNIPDAEAGTYKLASFKDQFPLKCQTQVVTVDYEDVSRLELEIANTIAGCWNLYGEGKYNIFPAEIYFGFGGLQSVCVPCARIHISPKVRDYYSRLGSEAINIRRALNQPFKGTTYLNYLNQGNGPFAAFVPGNAEPFDLVNRRTFEVDESQQKTTRVYNRVTEASEDGGVLGISQSTVYLPHFYDPSRGDLLVYYGAALADVNDGIGDYFPYLFYVHSKENFATEFDDILFNGPLWKNVYFCSAQEGIPA